MIQLKVNGAEQSFNGELEMPLHWYLRDILRLTGSKFGCGVGLYGACTVHINGEATRSCVTLMRDTSAKEVTTCEPIRVRTKRRPRERAMCHGPDGAGSPVGKSMNVPDLRSSVVQNTAGAELAQVISNGKGGMPAFKSSLSDDQIHALATYVRSLHQKK